jgi:hypothetical protein
MSYTLARLCSEWRLVLDKILSVWIFLRKNYKARSGKSKYSRYEYFDNIEESGKPLKKVFWKTESRWRRFLGNRKAIEENQILRPLKKSESRWRNQKTVEEDFLGFLGNRKAVEPLKKIKFWAREIWGLILTPNFWPRARMDLLDWFFNISTAHNFSFSSEVT